MSRRSDHRSDHRSEHRSDHRSSSSRHRSPSPAHRHRRPSREEHRERSEERDEKSLPKSFCRERSDDEIRKHVMDDNLNVLERMEKSFLGGPLEVLYRCISDNTRIKVWTRNYKEVRGICTGYIVAFDKHWNLVMKDVDEVFLKPRVGKTPYVWGLTSGDRDAISERKAKVPRKKKDVKLEVTEEKKVTSESEVTSATESAMESGSKSADEKPATEGQSTTEKKKKKKKRRKKKESVLDKRHVGQLFIRGDNVVMVALLNDEYEEEEEEEEEEEKDEKDIEEEAAGDT